MSDTVTIERVNISLDAIDTAIKRIEECELSIDDSEGLVLMLRDYRRLRESDFLKRLDEWLAAYMHDRHDHDEAAWLLARTRELVQP